jgi:fibronectin type 3 domain-containing protein
VELHRRFNLMPLRLLTRLVWFAAFGFSLAGCIGVVHDSPSAPVVSAQHSVTLAWDASTSLVSGYVVYRATNPAGPFTQLGLTLAGITKYVDVAVVSGQTYFYYTTSFDSANSQSWPSNMVSATIPTP